MRSRQRGATLALGITLALVLIVIGIALFYISKYIGGGREVVNTTDAMALDAAAALLRVTVPITKTEHWLQFREFTNHPDNNIGAPPADTTMDLASFNRAIVEAAIVQGNAADETANNKIDPALEPYLQATTNADKVADMIDEIGQAFNKQILTAGSAVPTNGTLSGAIANASSNNFLTLLNKKAGDNVATGYSCSYYRSVTAKPDSGASNVGMEGIKGMPSASGVHDHQGPGTGEIQFYPLITRFQTSAYMQGYTKIPRLSDASKFMVCTALNPFEKPHLITKTDFDADSQPAVAKAASCCPNAVKIQATVSGITTTAYAATGTGDPAKYQGQTNFHVGVSNGFVVIDNGLLAPTYAIPGTFDPKTPNSIDNNNPSVYQLLLQACGYNGQDKDTQNLQNPGINPDFTVKDPPVTAPRPVDFLIEFLTHRASEMTQLYGDAQSENLKREVTWLLLTTQAPPGTALCLYHKFGDPRGTLTLDPMAADLSSPGFVPAGLSPDGETGPEDTGSPNWNVDVLVPTPQTVPPYNPGKHPYLTTFDAGSRMSKITAASAAGVFGLKAANPPKAHEGVRWVASSGYQGFLGYLDFAEWKDP